MRFVNQRYLVPVCGTFALAGLTSAIMAGRNGGDLAKQQPTYHIDVIPPAPILTPDEELKTFKLPTGFHAELVAAEPLVEEPISIAFDPDGRMYVCELRGYMPDIDGTDEMAPVARIVRLESSKGDGHYDKSTIFLDKLVIPRAIGLAGDGVLVAEPPNLYFCRSTKGDGVCDQKTTIVTDYGNRIANPEHMANGLTWSIDNWYYNANYAGRFKYSKGTILRDATISRGQWGIAQDDIGRLFYNTNGSMLRCDFFPSQYLTRNPYLDSPAGVNIAIASNATHPARVNPGVNRGYTADTDAKGKLQRVTATCGPTIYRGGAFGAEYEGNAFICEPAGNLISRQVLSEKGVAISAKCVEHDDIDFLCSLDERFRPVNTFNAPDNTLYVVDLYHGIVQHGAYMSAYLEDQIKKRDLDKNKGHRGRIWRIVADGTKPGPLPHLSNAPAAELIKNLSNPNGWWRDTAQRLLVEHNDPKSIRLLLKMLDGSTPDIAPLAKVHALWALQGMDHIEDETTAPLVKDADPRVRLAAIRVAEVIVHKHAAPLTTAAMAALANDADASVQLQVLVTASPDLPELQSAATDILAGHLDDAVFRCAAVNSATGRELEFLNKLLTNPAFSKGNSKATHELLNELAECVVRSRNADQISKLLDLVAGLNGEKSQQEAMMAGVVDALVPRSTNAKTPTTKPTTKPTAKATTKRSTTKSTEAPAIVTRRLRLPHEPPAMAILLESKDEKVAEDAKKAESVMSWPNKPGDTTPPLTPLTGDQEKRFIAGQLLFTQICAQCHQPSGLGQDGIAPPLVDSEWVLGKQERVARIVLNGIHGPIKVGKKTMELEMPGLGALPDEQIASVLTYIRREWGHEGSPIDPTTITQVRKDSAGHGDVQWTAEELAKIK